MFPTVAVETLSVSAFSVDLQGLIHKSWSFSLILRDTILFSWCNLLEEEFVEFWHGLDYLPLHLSSSQSFN